MKQYCSVLLVLCTTLTCTSKVILEHTGHGAIMSSTQLSWLQQPHTCWTQSFPSLFLIHRSFAHAPRCKTLSELYFSSYSVTQHLHKCIILLLEFNSDHFRQSQLQCICANNTYIEVHFEEWGRDQLKTGL